MDGNTLKATQAALRVRGVSPGAWRLLFTLASRVPSRGAGFAVTVAQADLATNCEMSRSTVKRKLDELKLRGFVRMAPQTRDDGGTDTCEFTLIL